MKKKLSYTLDNISLIYPAIINKNHTTLYRFSACLTEIVHVGILQKALEHILPRFPIFRTRLCGGLFWPYLEESFRRPCLYADDTPCQGYRVDKKGHYPFRVLVKGERVSLETSHLIADGYGAMAFLKALLAEYFFLQGKYTARLDTGVITPYTPLHKDEVTDAYVQYASLKDITPLSRPGAAFIEPAKRLGAPFLKTLQLSMPLDAALAVAKAKDVTLTEWLVALYFCAYQDLMFNYPPKECYRRPIRITTPVDLRRFFPTKTMRNFIGLVALEIDPRLGVFSFDEILHEVHYTMRRELVAKHFIPAIGANVRTADARIIAGIPLFIKKPVVRWSHTNAMYKETSVLSNLGAINLPTAMEPYVEHLECWPAPKWINKRDCAVLSYRNELVVIFTRIVPCDLVEHYFYERLIQHGLSVRVEDLTC